MRRPAFIARQAERPSGLLGRALVAVMAHETRALNDDVLRRLAVRPGDRILEVGFGHGRTLERAVTANPEARFAGVDHASEMVGLVARRCGALIEAGRLALRTGTSSALPWPAQSFEGVFAVHTIPFWPQPEKDLGEIGRVLTPGGRVVLGFRERSPEAEAAFPASVYHFWSSAEVSDLLTATGFAPLLSRGPGTGLWIAEGRLG
jgi:ubiquinone/menaquinone biosynthesis C-methylase UbiE